MAATVRLLGSSARASAGARVRLLAASAKAATSPTAPKTTVRLLASSAKITSTAPPTVPAAITASATELEPGDVAILDATGTAGSAFTWAILPGSAPATLATSLAGSRCTVAPAANTGPGPVSVGVQVVAKVTGKPDSAAQISLTVYPVAYYRVGADRSLTPMIRYRIT